MYTSNHIEHENIYLGSDPVLIMHHPILIISGSEHPTRFIMVRVNMAFHQHNYQEDHSYKS
jgi:hypothetical protein